LVVVEGEDDDGLGAGEDEGGVGAALGIAGEPGHVAVFSFGEPLLEEGAVRGGLRGGDAAVVKAEGAGLGDEGGLELLRGELAVVGDGLQWLAVVGEAGEELAEVTRGGRGLWGE
jgi:hypothetical protein